jgi:multimeric flavodoxin WrbA
MKILGLIGSARKLGNCEILVKEALFTAKEKGAEIRAIRLTDFQLKPCKGCLACVLKGEPCRLDDDMHALWEHLQWADAIIISSPTYFLGPPGIIKMLIDRLFEFSLQLGSIKRRPAGIILTAGLREWDSLVNPILTILAGVLQLDIINSFTAYRPGPGEVLLDEETMTKAGQLGESLVSTLKNGVTLKQEFNENHQCPRCGNTLLQRHEENRLECALCQAQAHISIKNNFLNITWDLKNAKNRWSPEALAEHFSEWVIKTGPVFQKHRAKINELKERFRQLPIEPGPHSKS